MNRDHVWYIKYASAITILIAMLLHTLGVTPWNAYVQLLGATGWCYVGYRWNEKALLLNFMPQFAIIIPTLIWIYFINV
tara:strand:+ start:35943 stop:36179 length:237 start_codon:yes stop_codon:yes gene_type:complete